MSRSFDLKTVTDADASAIVWRAMKWVALLAVITAPLVAWKMGWQSACLLLAGALISAVGLWKWMRLMTAVMAQMEASEQNRPAVPLGRVLGGFFLILALMLVVLYGSLKLLDGSVYALFAGLGMGIAALTVEALRAVKAWTV